MLRTVTNEFRAYLSGTHLFKEYWSLMLIIRLGLGKFRQLCSGGKSTQPVQLGIQDRVFHSEIFFKVSSKKPSPFENVHLHN